MNRVIKFRGWSVLFNIWVYGSLITPNEDDDSFYIIDGSLSTGNPLTYEVVPESVGQFIGRHYKDGKEIYEGDICRTHDWIMQPNGTVILSDKYKVYKNVVIKYNAESLFVGYTIHDSYEKIGTAYENPELCEPNI